MRNIFKPTVIFMISIVIMSSCAKKGAFFSYNPDSHRYVKKQVPAFIEPLKQESYLASAHNQVAEDREMSFVSDVQEEQVAEKILMGNNTAIQEAATLEKANKVTKKQLRKAIKDIKKSKNSGDATSNDVNTILLIILAIILPPLAVALVKGLTGAFWLNLLLTLLFWVPGVIHAIIVIFNNRN